MTVLSLDQLLTLVGELNDEPGDRTAREEFRRYLRLNIRDLQLLAVYIDDCNSARDEQRARAFQDLVNHIGEFLGFEVSYGAYRTPDGRVGVDGRWRSDLGLDVIVEHKTDEDFTARRAGLARDIDRLISRGEIGDWRETLGLYVISGENVSTTFLEKLILAEPQAHRIRTITLPSLHTLAELSANQTLAHSQILDLMTAGAPRIDPLVDIVARVDSRAFRQFVAGIDTDGNDELTLEPPGSGDEPKDVESTTTLA